MSRYGLEKVYEPPTGVRAVAHVVLVHGLFGHPRKTWMGRLPRLRTTRSSSSRAASPSQKSARIEERGSTDERASAHTAHDNDEQDQADPDSVFWPQALLPRVIPDARIFTWGYDADIDGFLSTASQNTVHQHATNLLSDLADLRRSVEDKETPIIFLVHSLGGIIVKDALNQSSQTEGTRLKEIAPATHAICFLGTPHRGSNSASIGKLAYQIKVVATKRPNLKLLQALERNSETLDRVGDSFRQTLLKQKIHIYSFREEKETRRFLVLSSIIVNADSAKIGDAMEEVGSIPENHSNMTKFATETDIGFKRVSSQLRRWIEGIRSTEPDITQDHLECLASLDNKETRSRFDNVATSHDDTFHWLFDTAVVNFRKWLEDDLNSMGRVFWIQGKPGSGKSTLMKFAMRDNRTSTFLCEEGQWILAGFFFHDRGSDVQKSLSGMLQGIIHQILRQADQLIAIVLPFYVILARAQRTKLPHWDKETLESVLVAITKQRDISIRLCLFLDALDEHAGDNGQLADLIYKLTSNADNDRVRLKVCLASRSWTVFESHFGSCPGFAIHHHTEHDIQSYTISRLRQSLGARALTQGSNLLQRIDALAAQVTEKAQGVFIWVRLVVDLLEKGVQDGTPFSTLKEMVLTMPQELEDLYRHTLRRIESQYAEEAYIMLQIALCARSPMSLENFFRCTRYCERGEVSSEEEDLMVRHLVSRCGGLLETVLRPIGSSYPRGEGNYSKHQGPSAQAGSPGYENQSEDSQQREIQDAEEVPGDTRPDVVTVQFIHQTVKDFVRRNRSNVGLLLYDPRPQCGYLRLLQFGTRFAAASSARDISSQIFEYASLAEKDVMLDENMYHRALSQLLAPDEAEPRRSLLARWRMAYVPSIYPDEPHRQLTCMAVAAGLHRYVRHAIRFYYSRTISSSSPSLLQIAATAESIISGCRDRLEMVRLLLDLGVPVDQETSVAVTFKVPPFNGLWPRTTLYWMFYKRERLDLEIPEDSQERLSLVRLLLERGANPNIVQRTSSPPGLIEETALQHCVRYESVDMARLLIQHGADPTRIDGWISINPFNRNFEMRRLLEEHGCGHEAQKPTCPQMIAATATMPLAIMGFATGFHHPNILRKDTGGSLAIASHT